MVDIHELAAGKLAALLSRRRARDLFDCRRIFSLDTLDMSRLRVAFVVYGAMNRRDWRTAATDDVAFDPRELSSQLLPSLPASAVAGMDADEYGGAGCPGPIAGPWRDRRGVADAGRGAAAAHQCPAVAGMESPERTAAWGGCRNIAAGV